MKESFKTSDYRSEYFYHRSVPVCNKQVSYSCRSNRVFHHEWRVFVNLTVWTLKKDALKSLNFASYLISEGAKACPVTPICPWLPAPLPPSPPACMVWSWFLITNGLISLDSMRVTLSRRYWAAKEFEEITTIIAGVPSHKHKKCVKIHLRVVVRKRGACGKATWRKNRREWKPEMSEMHQSDQQGRTQAVPFHLRYFNPGNSC